MAKLTRRGFITRTSAGMATMGALVTVPGLAGAQVAAAVQEKNHAAPVLQGPLVAHVRNSVTGEIALFVGTREVIIQDHELVRRLMRAAQ